MLGPLGKLFGSLSPRRPPPVRAETLPFHVFLRLGMRAVPLFPAGPVEAFRFFQRTDVPARHEIEFLCRLAPEAVESEDYQPFGLFRLDGRRALPLFDADEVGRLWRTLTRRYGVVRVPEARNMVPNGFTGYDLRQENTRLGLNQLAPADGARVLSRPGRHRMTYAELLTVMRSAAPPRVRIAWIEDAFVDPPPRGRVVHRYYQGASHEVFLVRHHWRGDKQLFLAEASEEARRLCLASEAQARPEARAA